MCFDTDSAPPDPRDLRGCRLARRSGARGRRRQPVRRLRSGARRAGGTTGVVILPDVRGLYRFYEELALRFAERGYPAIAFDYFGRTAGVEKRDDDFDYMPHVQQTTPEGVQADVAAAVELSARGTAQRRSSPSASASAAASPGSPLRRATASRAPSASTACRASATASRGRPSAPPRSARRSSRFRRATTRTSPPRTTLRSMRRSRRPASSTRSSPTTGAPHSFFDRKQEQFADASNDAWGRVLAFVERYSG